MTRMIRRLLTVSFPLIFAVAGWRLVEACGPTFGMAVFSFRRHPDLPREPFLNGELGILQPTYARSYLVIAYRHLRGIGLDPREKEQVRDYFRDRGTGWWDKNDIDWVKARQGDLK